MKTSSLHILGSNSNFSLIVSGALHLLIIFLIFIFLSNKKSEYFSPEMEIGYQGGSQGSGNEKSVPAIKEIVPVPSSIKSDTFEKTKVKTDSTLADVPVTEPVEITTTSQAGSSTGGNAAGKGNGSGNGKGNGNGLGSGSGNGIGEGSGGVKVINADQLPFVPKQILEVVPFSEGKNITGVISLSLKIGTDGRVTTHKVIINTTGSNEELQNVIKAAYKSKWEAIKIKDAKVEYWVEKTYRFN